MTGSDLILILAVPVTLAFIMLAVVSVEKLILATLFFTPISIQLSYLSVAVPFDLSIPTEPVLALMLIITLFKIIVTGEFSLKVLRHPVTILLTIYLLWTLITAFTSTIPLVSLKAFAYRTWFIAGFYLIAAQLSLKEGFAGKYILAYAAGLTIVIVFFMVRVGGMGLLNQKFAHSACYPFFKDHTSFGASIAFLLSPLLVISLMPGKEKLLRMITGMLFVLFLTGFIFSYSRAAWVSLIAALAVSLVLWLRMPGKVLVLSGVVMVVVLVFSAGWIYQQMDSNTEDSSADLGQHLRSSSNISTDQSNLERINRWKCALKMFAEKPVTGWGPGTYQFNYAPFQRAEDKTPISTDFGDAGNAHSEYLGALSESGLPGAIIFVLIALAGVLTGVKVWYRDYNIFNGYLALALTTGLMTYVIHGVMNSFLDTDKIASLWWGFIAILVAMDISGKRQQEVKGE